MEPISEISRSNSRERSGSDVIGPVDTPEVTAIAVANRAASAKKSIRNSTPEVDRKRDRASKENRSISEKNKVSERSKVNNVIAEIVSNPKPEVPPVKEMAPKEKRHLAVKMKSLTPKGNEIALSAAVSSETRSSLRDESTQAAFGKLIFFGKREPPNPKQEDSQVLNCAKEAIDELKQQNLNLVEALVKIQKSHETEKKCFHEILFGIDRALSSLPIRLERIRVRNQKNLCMINAAGFQSGDTVEEAGEKRKEEMAADATNSDDSLKTVTSQESNCYVSGRMKCLLDKMDQMNHLIDEIKKKDSPSPIELLLNSELYAISLLKKEIKCTKKQIEENKTDTETGKSNDACSVQLSAKDSDFKRKNSFSNELNKASNFKIFENHMILQEEAMNLLTRKIGEIEDALKKKIEEKESLEKEKEAMAKEICRLKSVKEDDEEPEENLRKREKSKDGAPAKGRPYRLIKELRSKLEEQEKNLCAFKSKIARLNFANSNKGALLEAEKKKNSELATSVQNLIMQNKTLETQAISTQFLNRQMRDQIEILKEEVEILAGELLESQTKTTDAKSEGKNHASEKEVKASREGWREIEGGKHYQGVTKKMETQLRKSLAKNEEFFNTFKELIKMASNFGGDKDIKSVNRTSYDKVRKILGISSSDLEILLSAHAKESTQPEVEKLYRQCKSIVETNENKFSTILSSWIFDVIKMKFLAQCDGKAEDECGEGEKDGDNW